MGIANAAVFPEPVSAKPMMSRSRRSREQRVEGKEAEEGKPKPCRASGRDAF